jgi:hypothetical protein
MGEIYKQNAECGSTKLTEVRMPNDDWNTGGRAGDGAAHAVKVMLGDFEW